MAWEPGGESIRTARLELAPLTARFVRAVVEGDTVRAGAAIGAMVGGWLAADSSHLVELQLAGQAAEARGFPGVGRAILLALPDRPRRIIGSIGFHGPPDDRGRLEASCRINPAHQGRGYAWEALAALLDWATARYGITRFLVALPSRGDPRGPVPIEIALRRPRSIDARMDHIAKLLETGSRPSRSPRPVPD